jgi:hypothetical protein
MLVDERHQRRGRRSSSAGVKNADALRKISFARFNSRTSRSSSFIRSRSVVVSPARVPALRSSCRTHFRSVSGVQPSLLATDTMHARCDSWLGVCSNTNRTPRSRTSAGNFVRLVIAPSSQG